MIWMDSSFIIDWFIDDPKIGSYDLGKATLATTSFQYIEVLSFFLKKSETHFKEVVSELEAIKFVSPSGESLVEASRLYVSSKRKNPKISYADAVLATLAKNRHDTLLTFDNDFNDLGFQKIQGFWYPKK